MKRQHFLFGSAASLLSACAHRRPTTADFVTLSRDAQPLRAQFNADARKVRILMLVSPT